MPIFYYEAVDNQGNLLRGRMNALSEREVTERLASQQQRVVFIQREESRLRTRREFFRLKQVSLRDVLTFTRQLSTLVRAGVPIIRSLDSLIAQTTNPYMRQIIEEIRKDVTEGISLADALSKHPRVFSPLYISMVRVAETTGNMGEVLSKIAEFLENEETIKGRIKSALWYPAMVLSLAIVVLIILFFVVLPTFKGIFSEMGEQLPLITRLALSLTDWLLHWWFIIPIGIFGVFLFLDVYRRLPQGRYQLDLLKLKAPLFGPLVSKMAISRFARTLSTLLSAGVPLLLSLDIVRDVVANAVYASAIAITREQVREGSKLSALLANFSIFPPLLIQMIDTGEETGNLPGMAEEVARFYDEEVDRSIKALLSLLEPLLIILLAGIVGFVAFSIYLPLFKMVTVIH